MASPDTTNDLPNRTPDSAKSGTSVASSAPVIDPEELRERTRTPVDLTVDSEPDHERNRRARENLLPYDPVIHQATPQPNVQVDPATWNDLRALPAPPPVTTKGVVVFVCVAAPQMIVMDRDGESVVAQFQNGYLATDDTRVINLLRNHPDPSVKELDTSKMMGS
jgi:hypothetical protein